jgi:hypothetical protein
MAQEQKKKRQILIPKREEQDEVKNFRQLRKSIEEKIKTIFKEKIGEENAINSWDLYTQLFGNPHRHSILQREFFWHLLTSIIKSMRKRTVYFIISHNDLWFIPKREHEGKYYEDRLNSEIEGLKSSIKRCKEYIQNKEWQKIK